jgi:hypothetical protein
MEAERVTHSNDDVVVAQPEILTLHWAGPARSEPAPEHRFPDSVDEQNAARRAEFESELAAIGRSRQGSEIWGQIEREAASRGDRDLWRRKLHAYGWVKMNAEGSARDYALRHELNHATVRTWIADIAKLAYQVGYRLHEDKLLLVGEAPPALQRLRELVNADAASSEASCELALLAARFRGEDPYFHLNEGHVLRALCRLRASDETLREGLTVAEAPSVRALLWNARGQTFWDCSPESAYPLGDYLARAEKAFRRAAVLDQSTYFSFVNLAQMAADAGDERRCEYWVGELAVARKRMQDKMKHALGDYLDSAEWTRPMQQKRFWRSGPAKWILESARRGALVLLAALPLAFAAAIPRGDAAASSDAAFEQIESGREKAKAHGGAGGN